MEKRFVGRCWRLFIFAVTVSLVIALGSVVQAKDKKLMSKGFEMMLTSFQHMENGVQTVDKGVAMIDDIAKEKGVEKDIAAARKTIDGGMDIAGDGFKVFREGQKLYLDNKGKNNKAMFDGVDLMVKGGGTIGRAVKRIQEGVLTVNKVAKEKGFANMMEAPNNTIKTGVEMALRGVESFAEGKKLYVENK